MERKKNYEMKKENKEREIEILIELMVKTDVEMFATDSEKELMRKVEDRSTKLIAYANADPEMFLAVLEKEDSEMEVIKESKLMEAMQELSPVLGAAYLEKNTLEKITRILIELTDRLKKGGSKDTDEQSMKEFVRRCMASRKGIDHFIGVFKEGIEEAERVKKGLFFHPKHQNNARLVYHEGIHAIQDSVGLHAAQMADMPEQLTVSKEYGRIKFITELQDNKLVVENARNGMIKIPDNELLIELSYFRHNLAVIKRYI